MRDIRSNERDIKYYKRILEGEKERYYRKRLNNYGIVPLKYTPEWFYPLFGSYMTLIEVKRDQAINDYLTTDCAISKEIATTLFNRLKSHFDLLTEFYFFVKNGRFKSFQPRTAELYSAEQLHKEYGLSPAGAYNYLLFLREAPEKALHELKAGHPKDIERDTIPYIV